jgi:hypothetical protein
MHHLSEPKGYTSFSFLKIFCDFYVLNILSIHTDLEISYHIFGIRL